MPASPTEMNNPLNEQPVLRELIIPKLSNSNNGFQNHPSSSATGFRVNFSLRCPSGRPRWEQSTTDLAPFLRACSMEGRAPTMRAGLVMAPLGSWGTLKSHLKML